MATYRPNPAFAAKLRRAVDTGAARAAQLAASRVRNNLGRGARGTASAPGSPPNVQTGLLRNSIVVRKAGPAFYRMVSSAAYSRIHEFGGMIHPGPGKRALPVPINYAAKVLLQRVGPGGLKSAGVRMRMVKRPGKPPLLVGYDKYRTQKGYKGKRKVFVDERPVFLLAANVFMPKRPFVRPMIEGPENRAVYIAAAREGVARVLNGGAADVL